MIENNDALENAINEPTDEHKDDVVSIQDAQIVEEKDVSDKDAEKLVEVATEEVASEEETAEDEGEFIPPQLGRFTAHGLGYKRPANATKKRRKKNKIAKASRRRNQKNH